jgi:ankyrin repeat protein
MRLIILFIIILKAAPVYAECYNLCNMDWWEKNPSLNEVGAAINSGENVNGQVQGFSPLHFAAWKGTADHVYLLLHVGANIDAIEQSTGWTPLHSAVLVGNLDAVNMLLKKGANVSIKDATTFTPLHYAGLYMNRELVDALIGAGADPNDLNYE